MLLDSPIVSHLIQKLEADNDNLTFVRVDSDHIDKLIQKDEEQISKLSEDEAKTENSFRRISTKSNLHGSIGSDGQ